MSVIPAQLMTSTMRQAPWGEVVARILHAALQAADPERAVRYFMHRQGNILNIGDKQYDLSNFWNVYLVGAGKAVVPMASAAVDILEDKLNTGVVITKQGYLGLDSARLSYLQEKCTVRIYEASHPIPDKRGVTATQDIMRLVQQAEDRDLILCLISGGGSALLTAPPKGITLEDLQVLTSALLACGANIHEINTLRKHLDMVKGGRLAELASPTHLVTLVLSDVVGDPLDRIASGPTTPDPSSYSQAYAVLEKYRLFNEIPHSIVHHLELGKQGSLAETPKPGNILFERVQNVVIGNNYSAARAALSQASLEGYNVLLLSTYFQGEARELGNFLAGIAQQIASSGEPLPRPACLIVGGETTVTLHGNGLGGRNQEIALSAVKGLSGLPGIALITLATDGGDGPTEAAGALVTGDTLIRASSQNLDPDTFLAVNDAYNFFMPLGDLLTPGPTLTNVNDLAFLFAFK